MKNKPDYSLILSLVLIFSVLYFFSGNSLFIYIGFTIGILSLLSDKINYYLAEIWNKIISVIGTINAHIILTLVFFVILLPTALLYRFFNKDPLNLRKENSSFINREKLYEAADFENPW